jgi:hypothetical protein
MAALPTGAFGLGLSISSLQEMRADQVAGYLELLDRVCAGVVYLKQWARWDNQADGITQRFEDYPIRAVGRPCLAAERRSRPVLCRPPGRSPPHARLVSGRKSQGPSARCRGVVSATRR